MAHEPGFPTGVRSRSRKTPWLYFAAIALGLLVAAVTAFSAVFTCVTLGVVLSSSVYFGATWMAMTAGFLAARGVFWLANELGRRHT